MPCAPCAAKRRLEAHRAVVWPATRPLPLPAEILSPVTQAIRTWRGAVLHGEAWLKTQSPGPQRHQTAQLLRVWQAQLLSAEQRLVEIDHAVL